MARSPLGECCIQFVVSRLLIGSAIRAHPCFIAPRAACNLAIVIRASDRRDGADGRAIEIDLADAVKFVSRQRKCLMQEFIIRARYQRRNDVHTGDKHLAVNDSACFDCAGILYVLLRHRHTKAWRQCLADCRSRCERQNCFDYGSGHFVGAEPKRDAFRRRHNCCAHYQTPITEAFGNVTGPF